MKVLAAAAAVGLLLAGCSILPTTGPLADDVIQHGDNAAEARYVVTEIDERSVAILASHRGPTLYARFGDYRPAPETRIGVGDVIAVTIYEAASGGLFSSPPSNTFGTGSHSATIPEQIVNRDGSITIPYAGRIEVLGLSPAQVEQRIDERLTGKAIEPQAVVSVTKNISNTVTVNAEGTIGARVPLTPKGDRILDVIASTGGSQGTLHETFVRLTRGGATVTVPMETLLDNPRENVFVRPGDSIALVKEPQTFSAFGALTTNTVVPFGTIDLSLEEAIAKAGGLLDLKSDPDGVFLLRFEPPSIVHELARDRPMDPREKLIPVVYRLSLRDAKSYFLARSFKIRDKDILYIANAPANELQKVLTLVGTLTQPAISGASVAAAVSR